MFRIVDTNNSKRRVAFYLPTAAWRRFEWCLLPHGKTFSFDFFPSAVLGEGSVGVGLFSFSSIVLSSSSLVLGLWLGEGIDSPPFPFLISLVTHNTKQNSRFSWLYSGNSIFNCNGHQSNKCTSPFTSLFPSPLSPRPSQSSPSHWLLIEVGLVAHVPDDLVDNAKCAIHIRQGWCLVIVLSRGRGVGEGLGYCLPDWVLLPLVSYIWFTSQ